MHADGLVLLEGELVLLHGAGSETASTVDLFSFAWVHTWAEVVAIAYSEVAAAATIVIAFSFSFTLNLCLGCGSGLCENSGHWELGLSW